MAVDLDAPLIGIVEACQQLHDRRLAGAGLADERDGLPRRDLQVDAAQRLRWLAPAGVAGLQQPRILGSAPINRTCSLEAGAIGRHGIREAHVVEAEVAVQAADLLGIRWIGRERLELHQLGDPTHRHARLLPGVEHLRELLDR